MSRRGGPGAGPVVVLLLLAAVPAVALWALWRWADARSESAAPTPPASTTVVAVPTPAPPLLTPLASMRRVPTALARDLNLDAFRTDVQPLLAAVNDRSCVSVSVDGVDVGERNADVAVIPASAQKLLVAHAALEVLGPEHTYRTTVLGTVGADGVVAGDLHLVGGGDPVLSSDWYATSGMERFPVFNATSFDQLADAVVDAGVTRVTGRVVGDGTRYDDERYVSTWGPGVAGLEAGPYDALMANDSRVLGDELRSEDPVEAAAREFVRLLAERGVVVDGGSAVGPAPTGAPELGHVTSAPLADIVAEMLTNSDNNTAELMVKELGVATSATGTRDAGLSAVRTTLEPLGVDLGSLVLADGSGLSLDNRLTCPLLLELLAVNAIDGPLRSGLPVAGQTGTLADSFVGTEVEGELRGKTGTLNNPPFNADPPASKALAGDLPVGGGGGVEYALVLNGPTISDQSEYRPVWDLLAATLATYPSGPGPEELGPR